MFLHNLSNDQKATAVDLAGVLWAALISGEEQEEQVLEFLQSQTDLTPEEFEEIKQQYELQMKSVITLQELQELRQFYLDIELEYLWISQKDCSSFY